MIDPDNLLEELRFTSIGKARNWPSAEKSEFKLIRKEINTYGVGVPAAENVEINETFSGCRISTETILSQKKGFKNEKIVALTCSNPGLLKQFSVLALDFLNPRNRETIYRNPLSWWKNWIQLTGNTLRIKEPYSIIAELLLLKELTEKKLNPVWTASQKKIHDIETECFDCEVKSTLSHSSSCITVHGEFQLSDKKTLYLGFYRMEQSRSGFSINDLIDSLTDLGWSRSHLDGELTKMGYEPGSSIMKVKYRLVENKFYLVDSNFPSITPSLFVDGKIPRGISKINYTVNLDVLESKDTCLE